MKRRAVAIGELVLARAEGRELLLGVLLLAAGAVLSGVSAAAAYAAIFAGAAACILGLITLVLEERRHRATDHAQRERERAQMRRIAELAREFLFERELWRDALEWKAHWDAQRANPSREIPRPLEWSVVEILARGPADLVELASSDGWGAIGEALRTQMAEFTTAVDQEFPGPRAARRGDLRAVYDATQDIAAAAAALAQRRQRGVDAYWKGDPDKTARIRDEAPALVDAFCAAVVQLERSITSLDPTDDVARAIGASKERHRAAAAAETARHRELQRLAASAAEQLLHTAAPSAEYLGRSTLGRTDATLRDIAGDEHFAFAPTDEDAALADWRKRIAQAQRDLLAPVEGRGHEMHERTHFLFVRVHNDGVQELENAIQRIEEDRHTQRNSPVDAIAQNVERPRREVRDAVQRLVVRIDELRGLEVR